MNSNSAKNVYIKYMNNRISNSNKPVENVKPKGIMGMMRKQPEQPKKSTNPTDRAQAMFNEIRDQRKKMSNGRA
tara:strand:- start:5578 stop:5799 length:222 start_codon:yes stop_codon:yes gene_type:complete